MIGAHQVTVRRQPRSKKVWLVSCRTCGFSARQTSEAFANQRADKHRAETGTPADTELVA